MAPRKDTPSGEIPHFADEAEAAAFWDTHSPLDYPEDFAEVEATFARPLIKRGLTIKFSEETLQEIRALAREQGIGPSTLVRMWVLERLREHPRKSA